MEVVYIHFDKLYFDDAKRFTLSFKDEEEVRKIFFSKKKKIIRRMIYQRTVG